MIIIKTVVKVKHFLVECMDESRALGVIYRTKEKVVEIMQARRQTVARASKTLTLLLDSLPIVQVEHLSLTYL